MGEKSEIRRKEGLTGARCKTVERYWGVSWARSKARWLGGGYLVVDLDWWLQGGVVWGLGWLANASGRINWSGLCNARYSRTGKKWSLGQHLLV